MQFLHKAFDIGNSSLISPELFLKRVGNFKRNPAGIILNHQ